jgi:L-ascorbate metabolism protein UlaG (beta-lactamase superfamily)
MATIVKHLVPGLFGAALLLGLPAVAAAADGGDACTSLTPGLVGGPMLPADQEKIELRWLGTANYELDYKGQVFLLDTYYDRTPRTHPIGFHAKDVTRATAIFLGHGHFDHMADAVPVSKQTGAKVVGAPVTIAAAEKMGLPKDMGVAVKGGETLHYNGVTVDTALARHSSISPELFKANAHLFETDAGPLTPAEQEAKKAVVARGTFSPDVITKGTIAYAFTFDTGFKLVFFDSAGDVTEGDRALAEKLGPVDVEIVAYQGHPVAQRQIPYTLPLIKLFHPALYIPAHHDQDFGAFVDLGVEPLFEAIRDQMPDTKYLAPLYRQPICLDVRK